MASVSATERPLIWPRQINEVPKEIFHREDVYKLELKRIFRGAEWHPLAHRSEIPNAGDYKTSYIGESPVIVVHGNDGNIRVFDNSCTHRGTQLATCFRGQAAKFECPYHRWNFALDGELLGSPGKVDFPDGFKPEEYGLHQLRSDMSNGLVFATYSQDVADLKIYLGAAVDGMAAVLGEDEPLMLLGYQKVSFAANWKEYGDNEGYHAPLLHSAFTLLRWKGGAGSQIMTPGAHKVIRNPLTVPPPGYLDDHSLIETKDESCVPESVIVALFPVSIVLKHLDVLTIRYAFPKGADRTEVHYAYFARQSDDPALVKHRVRQSANLLGPSGMISLEDGAVFNRLHVGSKTPGNVAFQKGVVDAETMPDSFKHNDEAGNMVRWQHYREVMGFAQ
ncbi:phenylpropionate dioxygenase-like ring-hydroxylating dioxygenase large terminal subunit [Novosphingobium hassiacum]|uniref:Phenylpropionate dioxygenase-like ring-hydroxylating dioxygenase large terminal subunit n=1 Tax=Novosphingobium hassiacum TaxID=173676 RepID=A0A7W5ZYF8_9SPHN|nr:aromatic ring-hydroxylating dioxygenase subunit alpha [Novosphingobium hassiacum]MBB3862330.1 phenylpropionate dioxygenase-like ring-hydroxylating dioxygenase large terminal subunit [Novosphingobium hassiacum]